MGAGGWGTEPTRRSRLVSALPTVIVKYEGWGRGLGNCIHPPIPSRLHPSKNADCRTPRGYPNAEWPNVEWPNQASADPHAVGDLYHLPGRHARLEPRLPADLGKMTADPPPGPGCGQRRRGEHLHRAEVQGCRGNGGRWFRDNLSNLDQSLRLSRNRPPSKATALPRHTQNADPRPRTGVQLV